jgi:hypothetical protein
MIGEKLTPVLVELEETLMELEGHKPDWPIDGFRAGLFIFMSVFLDKVYDLQVSEGMDIKDAYAMVEKAGEELKYLIKVYTDIDTKKLYEP